MIGDRYDHDIAGASAVGMTAIGYGAEEGPETDYAIDDLKDVLSIVGVEREREEEWGVTRRRSESGVRLRRGRGRKTRPWR